MYIPESAIVVTPHPDDAEIGCGGTIAKWIEAGSRVYYVLCTNGDKGTSDPNMTSEKLKTIRAKEQYAAAKYLGVKEVIMLGYGDGELEDSREFLGKLVREIRRLKPECVLCPDPFRTEPYWHRDHRICGTVTCDAVFPYARDRLHFSELSEDGFSPHKVKKLLFWGTQTPNKYFDISNTIEKKTTALYYHASQVGPKEKGKGPELWIKKSATENGKKTGYVYAEAYREIDFG